MLIPWFPLTIIVLSLSGAVEADLCYEEGGYRGVPLIMIVLPCFFSIKKIDYYLFIIKNYIFYLVKNLTFFSIGIEDDIKEFTMLTHPVQPIQLDSFVSKKNLI